MRRVFIGTALMLAVIAGASACSSSSGSGGGGNVTKPDCHMVSEQYVSGYQKIVNGQYVDPVYATKQVEECS